jgi:hypothetical protein
MNTQQIEKVPEIEFTDRYKATGTPYPTKDSCDWCDGVGISPMSKATANKRACLTSHGKIIIVGQKEKDGKPCTDDQFLFVKCPECFGTRKKNPTNEEKLEKLKEMFNIN